MGGAPDHLPGRERSPVPSPQILDEAQRQPAGGTDPDHQTHQFQVRTVSAPGGFWMRAGE